MPSRNDKRPRTPRNTLREQINPEVKAQLLVANRTWNLKEFMEADGSADHPTILLETHPTMRAINLTVQTTEELVAFRKFVNDAIDRAIKITSELDRIAQEEYAQGVTRSKRLWRNAPARRDFETLVPTGHLTRASGPGHVDPDGLIIEEGSDPLA